MALGGRHHLPQGPKKTWPARRRFVAQRVTEEGREKTYWLYDQPRVSVGRLRPHRRRRRPAWGRSICGCVSDGAARRRPSDGASSATVADLSRPCVLSSRVVCQPLSAKRTYFSTWTRNSALDALWNTVWTTFSEQASRSQFGSECVGQERQQLRAERTRAARGTGCRGGCQ